MSFPYFISPEQAMRERSELARKGISRGRSVVVLAYDGGVLFVAENPSRSLQKVSELYDRVGFAAVGAHGLEGELLAVHLVADSVDGIAQRVAERGFDLEVFAEAFAQAEPIE